MTANKCSNTFKDTNLTPNMEDYIETIAELLKTSKVVRVKDIAKNLEIKMPSVTAALNKLKEKNLINYEKYGYIELTSEGEIIAKRVQVKHKCIADFLNNFLGLKNKEADSEACKLEHYLSSNTCSQIEKLMKFFSEAKENNEKWVDDLSEHLN